MRSTSPRDLALERRVAIKVPAPEPCIPAGRRCSVARARLPGRSPPRKTSSMYTRASTAACRSWSPGTSSARRWLTIWCRRCGSRCHPAGPGGQPGAAALPCRAGRARRRHHPPRYQARQRDGGAGAAGHPDGLSGLAKSPTRAGPGTHHRHARLPGAGNRSPPPAPEEARRCDVYALGMSIYELIAGKLPFPSGEVADVLRKHREEDPMPPSVFRPDLPEVFDRRCWPGGARSQPALPDLRRSDGGAHRGAPNPAPPAAAGAGGRRRSAGPRPAADVRRAAAPDAEVVMVTDGDQVLEERSACRFGPSSWTWPAEAQRRRGLRHAARPRRPPMCRSSSCLSAAPASQRSRAVAPARVQAVVQKTSAWMV